MARHHRRRPLSQAVVADVRRFRMAPSSATPSSIVIQVAGSVMAAIGDQALTPRLSQPNNGSLDRLKIVIDACPKESRLYSKSLALGTHDVAGEADEPESKGLTFVSSPCTAYENNGSAAEAGSAIR
jgi:hypothetical protein